MILVIAEHGSDQAHRATREVLAAAQPLGLPITLVIPGVALDAEAAAFADTAVHEIVRLEADVLRVFTSSGYVAALEPLVRALAPALVLLPHSYQSRDFAPRLAARLHAPLAADCTRLKGAWPLLVATRAICQGKLLVDVALEGPGPHIITMQAGAHRADDVASGSVRAPVRLVAAEVSASAPGAPPNAPFRRSAEGADLTRAERIVSAGRGFKDPSQLALARELAAALGAELAATRPLCDAGWLPIDRQVGSSGQTVSPRLYVALGVSGAIQHLIGMKGSKTIVAVNTDPDAPIFEVADYGIVGDLLEVIPALVAALRRASA